MRDVFYEQTKFPSKKQMFGGKVHKICMLQGRIQPVRLGGQF